MSGIVHIIEYYILIRIFILYGIAHIIVEILKKLPNCFPKYLSIHFTFPLAVYKSSSCLTPSSILDVVKFLKFQPF